MLANADIRAAVSAQRRSYEVESGITREQVISELHTAIETAKTQGDTRSMIAGWREIARIMGYYDQPKETKIHINIAAKRVIQQMETMTDSELLEMIDQVEV